jgi:hypothetical protein
MHRNSQRGDKQRAAGDNRFDTGIFLHDLIHTGVGAGPADEIDFFDFLSSNMLVDDIANFFHHGSDRWKERQLFLRVFFERLGLFERDIFRARDDQ